ncbi:hypothetical protein O7626_40230 [Micromonospora sp. WMMD1102]|uniref:hypothetical protein n=1 Tax=Micromonospora sp. WMMD1102 TaxID=3016105 RepID=UPI0024158292|nr:hypothetical protein [Micromonospora sp. WMMD1102]MDG4792046.1 hypothetical protein [Micromonospora sp. WMMD1102]
MPTPKLPADQIAQLRRLADEYVAAHEDGPYAAKTTKDRGGHAHRFVDYLEGRYDPATDYGKRIVP